MNGKTKSILLQVAFKEAVSSVNAQSTFDTKAVAERTTDFYNMLVGLHATLDIEPDEGGSRGSGGGWGGNRRSNNTASRLPESASKFMINGQEWVDYREAKANGEVKAGFPDFKSADFKDSVYINEKDGSPNPAAAPYVAAAGLEVL